MPEFEENNQTNKTENPYIPSTDAKPRSRRRSGGFKTDYSNNNSLNIGEIDPGQVPKEATPQKPIDTSNATIPSKDPVQNKETHTESKTMAKKAPISQETLRVIQEIEEKIAEKKLARDAQQKDKKSRNPKGKRNVGFLGSILNGIKALFGIKPKKKQYSRKKGYRPNYKKKRYNRRRS